MRLSRMVLPRETQGAVNVGSAIRSMMMGSSLYQVGLVGLVPAWRVDGGKIVSLTA